LRRVAAQSHANTLDLVDQLEAIKGVKRIFTGTIFHEAALSLPAPAAGVLAKLKQKGIVGGLDLHGYYPDLGNAVLVCATETKTATDIRAYTDALKHALSS